MIKKTISLIAIIFIFQYGIGQEIPSFIKEIITKDCDEKFVFVSIIRSDQLSKIFPHEIFNKYYDFEKHNLRYFENITLKNFINDLSVYYNKCQNKPYVKKILNMWCNENVFLNSLYISDETPPEAILFSYSKTKKLFKKFIKNNSRMSWYSLSTSQLFELNIDFLNYYNNLSVVEQQQVNKELQVEKYKFQRKK